MISASLFKIGFKVSIISSTILPLRNHGITLCYFVVGRSSLIPDIVDSPVLVTVPFGC